MRINHVYCGDCVEVMRKEIPDGSIDLVVTSPPYDQIRDYGKDWTLDLHAIGVEIGRILRPGGVCAMVIQDQTKLVKSLTSFRTIVDWVDSTELNLWECCIYRRKGTPGNWWSKRFRVDHEYLPIFVKGMKPQFFDKEPLKIPSNWAGEGSWTSNTRTRTTKGELIGDKDFVTKDMTCRGTVWDCTKMMAIENLRKGIKKQHPATFPDQLAADIILAFSRPNMIVLDPMCGSGSTLVSALKLGRQYIGIDINPDYVALSEERVRETEERLMSN